MLKNVLLYGHHLQEGTPRGAALACHPGPGDAEALHAASKSGPNQQAAQLT